MVLRDQTKLVISARMLRSRKARLALEEDDVLRGQEAQASSQCSTIGLREVPVAGRHQEVETLRRQCGPCAATRRRRVPRALIFLLARWAAWVLKQLRLAFDLHRDRFHALVE